jgi:hypothetical protein
MIELTDHRDKNIPVPLEHHSPDVDPPHLRPADYPGFHKLAHRLPLTVESVVKLARAVD